MDIPYAYSLQPISPDGEVSKSNTIVPPFMGAYPMTCWKPSDGHLTDRLKIPLPDTRAGDWWVNLEVIDPDTGEALNVVAQDGSRTQQMKLGPFH